MSDATLSEFLLARVAEDEERIVHEFDCERFNVTDYGTRQGKCDCDATDRLKAECEAKRQIVMECVEGMRWDVACMEGHLSNLDLILRFLGATYAHHRDYRAEWRP